MGSVRSLKMRRNISLIFAPVLMLVILVVWWSGGLVALNLKAPTSDLGSKRAERAQDRKQNHPYSANSRYQIKTSKALRSLKFSGIIRTENSQNSTKYARHADIF